jgi:hypothetical protein
MQLSRILPIVKTSERDRETYRHEMIRSEAEVRCTMQADSERERYGEVKQNVNEARRA